MNTPPPAPPEKDPTMLIGHILQILLELQSVSAVRPVEKLYLQMAVQVLEELLKRPEGTQKGLKSPVKGGK